MYKIILLSGVEYSITVLRHQVMKLLYVSSPMTRIPEDQFV